jgi:hypothetical protein
MNGPLGEAQSAILFDAHEQQALDACLKVRADQLDGEERLRRTIKAGRLLRAVKRTPGARTDLINRLDQVTA